MGAQVHGARDRSPSRAPKARTCPRDREHRTKKEENCMSPRPSGRIAGNELIITRTFRAPIDDVWTSVTKSESLERWYGRWEGEAGPGKTVRLLMVFEGPDAWTNVTID